MIKWVAGIIGSVLTGVLIFWLTEGVQKSNSISDFSSHSVSESASNYNDTLIYSSLNEEQIRWEIDKLLKKENIGKAISMTDYLSDDAKEEEVLRIFNFCIKNKRFSIAEELLVLFELSSNRKYAEKQIALEKLKR